MSFLDSELFNQIFYGAVMAFYAVVCVWIMFFYKENK
jgi:hypothetical protein